MDVIPRGCVLSIDGIVETGFAYKLPFSKEPLEVNERVLRLVEWLRENVEVSPRKHIGSYSGKHIYEKLTDQYVSNGEFIMAMLLAGFTNIRMYKGCVNVDFMAKWKETKPVAPGSIGNIVAESPLDASRGRGHGKRSKSPKEQGGPLAPVEL